MCRERNKVQRADGRAEKGAAAFWLAALLIFGLFGCGQKAFESQQALSTESESASVVSDPLDLTENPLFEPSNRSVRITGGEPEILSFLKLRRQSINRISNSTLINKNQKIKTPFTKTKNPHPKHSTYTP